MIYLDSNATTQVDAAVLEAMLPFLSQHFGNPSSQHAAGRIARRAVERARAQVAALISADPDEIIFTSCGTEAINAVHLFARQEWPQRPLLVIGATEHSAVLECAARWQSQGGQVKQVPVDRSGVIDLDALRSSLHPGRTALVSIMWANNETGVLAPIREICDLAHEAGALVHVDAVQAVGKIACDVSTLDVDYLSLSGHKMHAPKGVGALYVSRRVVFRPLLVGGGQEQGRRSGTENVPGIVALGAAAELCQNGLQRGEQARIAAMRDGFEQKLLQAMPDLGIHGRGTARLPNTSSVCFPGVDAPGLLILLDQRGIACSGGSACHAGTLHPSHVLEAMGYDARHAGSTLRFSLSHLNAQDEVSQAADEVIAAVSKMRSLFDSGSPVALS